ncbi:hypothetical protein Bca4012_068042 [Brassica carinata]
MHSTNENSSSIPPPNSKDKTPALPWNEASMESSLLAPDSACGPNSTDLQGNEGGASLPCADSLVPVSNTPPSSQLPPSVPVSNSQPPTIVTFTMSSPISTEARDKGASPPDTESSSVYIQTDTQFVPSLGSWAKPLIFKPVPTPPDPSTPKGYDPVIPVTTELGIRMVPTFKILKDGKVRKEVVGAKFDELLAAIDAARSD